LTVICNYVIYNTVKHQMSRYFLLYITFQIDSIMKKDTTKERQKRWRQKRLTENKRVLTVWVSDEDMETIEKLKKQYQEESNSSLISRVISEFDHVIYNE
jgi:hypothetical protein